MLLVIILTFDLIGLYAQGIVEEETPNVTQSDRSRGITQSAEIVGDFEFLPYLGDLWATTWADDDRLYMAFGDGTGMSNCVPTHNFKTPGEVSGLDWPHREVFPGCFKMITPYLPPEEQFCEVFDCTKCYPLCPFTPVGLVALEGTVPNFADCEGEDQCVVSRHIPYGNEEVFENSDKPSSLLFIQKRMYMQLHYPPGVPIYGYVAYSDDYGKNWTEIENSPWGGSSNFKVMMFINMGQAYSLNKDGFVYGLGISDEVDLANPTRQSVYLARVAAERYIKEGVEIDPILNYDHYEYFTGLDAKGNPIWSKEVSSAKPLKGIETIATGAAMYHEGIGRYLFLSGLQNIAPGGKIGLAGVPVDAASGALYEAPKPWGPWSKVAAFPSAYIPSLIPKGAGPDYFYFTAAGGSASYNLNIGRIEMEVE